MQADNHAHIESKLDYFIGSKKIPNIIFHGPSGSGKRTIIDGFLYKIYEGDRDKMKKHIMTVECSHGKGIKFIREDLKFFAKSHIQSNQGANFKSIVLLNADSLTIDAQSALRRCIELFSHNTRFFIIVENKERLLNPILSRFCEIYVSPLSGGLGWGGGVGDPPGWERYQSLREAYGERTGGSEVGVGESDVVGDLLGPLVREATEWCEAGLSAMDWIACVRWGGDGGGGGSGTGSGSGNLTRKVTLMTMCYHKIKPGFRSEKLLCYYVMYFTWVSSETDLENILL